MSDPTQAAPMTVPSSAIAMVSGNDLLVRLDTHTERLVRIETLVTDTPQKIQHLTERIDGTVARVNELERWRAFWTGVTAVIALLLSCGVVAAFVTALHHH